MRKEDISARYQDIKPLIDGFEITLRKLNHPPTSKQIDSEQRRILARSLRDISQLMLALASDITRDELPEMLKSIHPKSC